MATSTPSTPIARTAQISLTEVTVDAIVSNAAVVGAPTTATVLTGYGNPVTVPGSEGYQPYTVTYSWTE